MKKILISLSLFAALVANGQAVDSSLFHIGAGGRLIKADTSSSNLIIEKRVNNTVQYGFNWNGIVNGASADPNFVSKQSQVIPNTLTNVVTGFATPQSLNGVLYNIINDYTGQQSNYMPITKYADGTAMTDSKVDSILVIKTNGLYYKLSKQSMNVKDFGAKGDGTTDDYYALQKAVNVCSYWGIDLYIPAGTFIYSQTIDLPLTYVTGSANTFFTINLTGAGSRVTVLQYTGSGRAIQAIGGSGAFSGNVIQGIKFYGTSTSTAYYSGGRDGVRFLNCNFSPNAHGIYLDNYAPGVFNEHIIAENCFFENTCKTVMEFHVGDNTSILHNNGYMYTSGNTLIDQSFNGCGLKGCSMNLDVANDRPVVIHAGALPYNAFMDCQFWTYGWGKTIIDCQSALTPNFMGNLTVEEMASGTGTVNQVAGGNKVVLAGNVDYAGITNNGTLFITNTMNTTGPSYGNLIVPAIAPASFASTVTTGIDTIPNAAAGDGTEGFTYKVSIFGPSVQAQYMLHVTPDVFGGNGIITDKTTIREYITDASIARPRFSTLGRSLLVTIRNTDGSLNTAAYGITVHTSVIGKNINTLQ